jgi:hypothetical protein
VTENPGDFEMFTYYVQNMENRGLVETPVGRSLDREYKGDWVDVQSYSINGSREVLGFVPVRIDSAQRLRGYEEGIRDGSEPSYFTVDIYPNVYEQPP